MTPSRFVLPKRFARLKRQRLAGFTLIELLVVLVVIGFVAALAIPRLGGGSHLRELQNEVNRLHAVLRMASEEAIMSNSEIGVVLEPDLYEFVIWDEPPGQSGRWLNAEQSFLRSYPLPDWLTLDFQREGKAKPILGENNKQQSQGDLFEKKTKTPQLMLLSSGEVENFTIGLQIKDDPDSRVEIKTNEQGEIILPALDQDDARSR